MTILANTTDKHYSIIPFSIVGLYVFHKLALASKNVSCFCDNASEKHGKIYQGTPVLSPDDAAQTFANNLYILSSLEKSDEIQEQLLGLSVPRESIISYEKILTQDELETLHDLVSLEQATDILPHFAEKANEVRLTKAKYFLPGGLGEDEIPLVESQIDICITEKCSLHCQDCSNCMQYFKEPKHLSMQEVLAGFRAYINSIPYVRSLNLLGGEPLLHPHVAEIAQGIHASGKVGLLTIITNGTIVPKQGTLLKLKQADVLFAISDYGVFSKKKKDLISALAEIGIPYMVLPIQTWYVSRQLLAKPLDEEITLANFKACDASCKTLKGSIYYHCPVAAHAKVLSASPAPHLDGIDFSSDEFSISDFLTYKQKKKPLPVCAFCSGNDRIHDPQPIEPAIQSSNVKPYTKFESQ